MAGIYIHIPFCRTKCGYCDFYSVTNYGGTEKTISGIIHELEYQKDYLINQPLRTIYFGGGTPSLCTPAQIQSVIDKIGSLWDISQVEEVTLEANPDDLTPDYLRELSRSNVNRLSIGIQSFIDRDLRFMNRRHSAEQATQSVRNARQAGFDNITIDLIFGIPALSQNEWKANIEKALALDVEHISAYHLTFEPGTPMGNLFEAGGLMHVDDEASREQYILLNEMLTSGGYEHYELSSFGRQGRHSLHNNAYWSGDHYLGLGPSAHSYNGVKRRWVVSSIAKYLAGVGGDTIYQSEILSEDDRYNEFVMLSLRLSTGIDITELKRRFGDKRATCFLNASEKFIKIGHLKTNGIKYWIEPADFLKADTITSSLFL